MKNKKYYWKVVSRNGISKKYSSIIVYGKYSVDYEIGKWSRPKIGKIFIFETRAAARNFIRGRYDASILKVEARNPEPPEYKRICARVVNSEIELCWQRFGSTISGAIRPPNFTVFADAILPIEVAR